MPVRTITEVAAEVGVSSDTLRYYEKAGLVVPSGNTEAGYRLYGDDIVDRVRLIKGAHNAAACALRIVNGTTTYTTSDPIQLDQGK